jgi:tetratricopeptide (TPR) repeat protein
MDTLSMKSLPPVPRKLPVRETKSLIPWRLRAEETSTLLIFQSLENLTGDTDFFRDTQSVLFLVARHFLLPVLKSRNLRPEHDLLINAMYMHIMLTWQDPPAHQYYLKSTLLDYLGLKEEARKSLLAAFETTSPQDHDFLTKAQAYWSYLLDCGRYDEAKAFVLQLYRTAPSTCLEEIQEMIKDLFQFLLTNKVAI